MNEQKIKLGPISCVPANSTLPSVAVQNLNKRAHSFILFNFFSLVSLVQLFSSFFFFYFKIEPSHHFAFQMIIFYYFFLQLTVPQGNYYFK